MAIYHEDIVSIDLEGRSIHRSFAKVSIGTGDQNANRFGVRVFRKGEPVSLSNVSCQGVFRDPMGNPIALTSHGTVEGNVAYLTLPQACYNYEGQFCLAIKLIGGGVTGTMRIVDGMVDNTHTGGAVAPTGAVPTYQEVLAAYDAAIAAVEDVNELKSALNISNPSLILTSGSYINYNGGISSGTSFSYSSAVAVKKGDIVRVNATGYSTNVAMISKCDQSGNVISVLVRSDGNSGKAYEYFFTEDGYACFSFKHTEPYEVTIIGNPYLGESIAGQILTKNLPVQFRIGNITITNSGWSYNSSLTRVSTVEGYTIHLRPGDIIGLTNYTGYRYFIGWKKSDGTYGSKGWNTADYVVVDEGDYVVNITEVPEATVANVSDLANLFKYIIFEDANSIFKYVSDNDSMLEKEIKELSNLSIGLSNPIIVPQKARFAMHRGLSSEAPENTVPAFTLAGQRGAWAIETDIYETTDGEFVCFHDDTVDRMTDGTGDIADMSYSQVQALTINAGSNIDQYPNLKIPKLITYLQICKKYGCVAFIEIKAITNYDNMINVVKKIGMEKSCVFLVATEGKLKSIRANTNAPIAYLGYQTSNNADIIALLENYNNCWADLYASTIEDSTYPDLAHLKNIPVVVWTTDTEATAETLFEYGVDVVTSNAITKLE